MNYSLEVINIMKWFLKTFDQLDTKTFWQIMYLREHVFVAEQNCAYPEADQQDLHSYHLFAKDTQGKLVAYARFFKTNDIYTFGRVVVPKTHRGEGLGAKLVQRILSEMQKVYGKQKIEIAAQYYARNFYAKLGFKPMGKPFIEAYRKHIKMVKKI